MNVLQTMVSICGMSMERVVKDMASINGMMILEDVRDNGHAGTWELSGKCCHDRRMIKITILEWCRGWKVSTRDEQTASMYLGGRYDDEIALAISLEFVLVQLTYKIWKPRWSFDAQKTIQGTRPGNYPLRHSVYLA